MHIHTVHAPDFPKGIIELADPPSKLYVRGDPAVLHHTATLGVVGSRKMSRYGERVLQTLIPPLVHAGITIVSGLAFGVDITAHRLTLEQNGAAIAVLGSGISMITPRSHEEDGERIAVSGALVSEYPGSTPAQKHHFPARNRLIAGLSQALLVVEGTERSGSLITADIMLQLGRDVLAIPGPIDAPLSRGTNMLIANGAHLIQSPDDIMTLFGIDTSARFSVSSDVSPDERRILSVLTEEPHTFDEICRLCTLSPSTVNGSLTTLELNALITKDSYGRYVRT